jgi:hypothetical protein
VKGEVNPEMESVRKLVSGRLETQAFGPHPEADLLSGFAESALPGAERAQVLAHLAVCRECREIVFLALPQPADGQKVLIPRLSRWHSALRWGTVMASIAIIAGVFAARRELLHSPARWAKSTPVSQLPAKSKVAEEKTPTDLGSTSEAGSKNQAVKAPMPVPARVRPDLKHMTAKMQRTLTFGQSDEVKVSPGASANVTVNAGAIRDLPVPRREALEFNVAAPPAAAPKTVNAEEKNEVGAPVPNRSDIVLVPTGTRAPAKQAALNPHLAGTVFDVAGAVVPNAKVTTVGSFGGPIRTETVTSDAQGRFAFDALPPGFYSVRAQASGFRSTELNQVAIAANQSPSLELKLTPAAEMETVEVSGSAAPIELESSAAVQSNISAQKVQTHGASKAAAAGYTAAGVVPGLQWTLSPAGAVQSSKDGGKTWQMVAVAANTNFRALSAVGRSIWVGGLGGILYHSVDAGRNWTPVIPTIPGQKLNSDITRIEFLDSRNGTLSTSSGEGWITRDGGNSWERN